MRVRFGNARVDGQDYHQWFVGHFVAEPGLRRSNDLEVKLSRHCEPYFEDGSTANQSATTLSVNIAGRYVYHFSEDDGQSWQSGTLSVPGDYALWGPGVLHCLDVPESCEMLVVRWPSVAFDKVKRVRPTRSR